MPKTYTFTVSRFYSPSERYSSGSGWSCGGYSLAEAKARFDGHTDDKGETSCVTVTNSAGTVLHHKGPSVAATEASMHAAHFRRNSALSVPPRVAMPDAGVKVIEAFRALTPAQQSEFFVLVAHDTTFAPNVRAAASE